MSVVVTGATGQFGRLVVQELLDRGFPADQIVATGRRTDSLTDLAAAGVAVRSADFDDPAGLEAAFAGAGSLLLVSASTLGERVRQHTNAIQAAVRAGVAQIAYTSVLNAGTTRMTLAAEHQATEALLAGSGVPFTLLRNGWYLENYTQQIPVYLQTGGVFGAAGQGRISGAARADYAAAAATVLSQDGHSGRVYELGGSDSFTLSDLAAQVSAATGRQIGYTNLTPEQLTAALAGAGLAQPVAEMLADVDSWIEKGTLFTDSGDLARLAGRPLTSLAEAVSGAAVAVGG